MNTLYYNGADQPAPGSLRGPSSAHDTLLHPYPLQITDSFSFPFHKKKLLFSQGNKTTQRKLKILVNESLSLILSYTSQFYRFFWQSKMARLRFSTHVMVLKLRGWLLWSPNKALETSPCARSDVCLNAPFLNVKIANIATFGWKYWILARLKP